MSIVVSNNGELVYSSRYKGLPCETWKLLFEAYTRQPVLGQHGWPVFGCEEHPELGLYEVSPTTDLVMKIVIN